MRDLGLLIIRLIPGGLLVGHGSQKLFGWFGGTGLQGTGGWMESMGLRPGRFWAALAGFGEFTGGLLTALGLFHPLGPLLMLAPMSVATNTAHAGKPIWAAQGGAELPVTNMAAAFGIALAGPGSFSLDRLLEIRVPRLLVALVGAGVVVGSAVTIARWREAQKPQVEAPTEEAAHEEPQGGKKATA